MLKRSGPLQISCTNFLLRDQFRQILKKRSTYVGAPVPLPPITQAQIKDRVPPQFTWLLYDF